MDQGGFIKYVLIIAVILLVAFFSQKAYTGWVGKNLVSAVGTQAGAYLSKSTEWFTANVMSKISGEVQSRGDAIKNEVTQQKENISQNVSENILKKTENYFTGIKDSVLDPGKKVDCPPLTSAPATK